MILTYLYKFGAIFIFFALMFGVIGLPVPDEILTIGSGYLIKQGYINPVFTVLATCAGTMSGITVSYMLGRWAGPKFVKKFGSKIHITEKRVEIVKKWFTRLGKWVLMVGYFIPFFRHVVGFVAGATKVDYKIFALYAYSGAIIWSITFLLIGYYFRQEALNALQLLK